MRSSWSYHDKMSTILFNLGWRSVRGYSLQFPVNLILPIVELVQIAHLLLHGHWALPKVLRVQITSSDYPKDKAGTNMQVLALKQRSSVLPLSPKMPWTNYKTSHVLGHSSGMALGHPGITFKDTRGSLTQLQARHRGAL